MSGAHLSITPLSRVGVIGDVHAEDRSLEIVLNFLKNAAVTTILCTGDVADGAGDVSRCCALLEEADARTVRGNHDRWLFEERTDESDDEAQAALSLEARAYLMTLPKTRRFVTPYGHLLLCHGLGEDDMAGFYPNEEGAALEMNQALHALVATAECRYVVNGHTHVRMVRGFDGVTFLNAGTLHRGYDRGFLVIDFPERQVTFFDLVNGDEIRESKTVRLVA